MVSTIEIPWLLRVVTTSGEADAEASEEAGEQECSGEIEGDSLRTNISNGHGMKLEQ
jgi:hypothetical protein